MCVVLIESLILYLKRFYLFFFSFNLIWSHVWVCVRAVSSGQWVEHRIFMYIANRMCHTYVHSICWWCSKVQISLISIKSLIFYLYIGVAVMGCDQWAICILYPFNNIFNSYSILHTYMSIVFTMWVYLTVRST